MIELYLVMCVSDGRIISPHSLYLLRRDAEDKARAISGIGDDGIVRECSVMPVKLSCDLQGLELLMAHASEALHAEL